jgi:hypothetical protein
LNALETPKVCDNDISEYLIFCKNYGGGHSRLKLKNPSEKFFKICLMWVQIFEYIFYETPLKDNIAARIEKTCKNVINSNVEYKWYYQFCDKHNEKILKKFIIVSVII